MSDRGRIRNGVVILDPPVNLAEGMEVEVRPIGDNGDERSDAPVRASTGRATLYERYQGIVGIAEGLPPDFAENHDHYIHGTALAAVGTEPPCQANGRRDVPPRRML